MVGWADCTVSDWDYHTVADSDLGGSLDRSSIHLLEDSWAAAEDTAADCRTQHRIAAGFGMAAGVAADNSLLTDRTDFHHIAGAGDHGDTAGMPGRWIRSTTGVEHGPCSAHCCMVAVGSLAVASDHVLVDQEFHSSRIAEAARRTSVVAVVVGSNPGSSRSCCPCRRDLVVDIGSCFRCADFTTLLIVMVRRQEGEMKMRRKIYLPTPELRLACIACRAELQSFEQGTATAVGAIQEPTSPAFCSAHLTSYGHVFTSSHSPVGTGEIKTNLSKPSVLLKHSWTGGKAKEERFHFNDAGNGILIRGLLPVSDCLHTGKDYFPEG